MVGIEILATLTIGLTGFGLFEAVRHQRILNRIPVRIHVNGTRGKSSVARLIAAGLREGDRKTCAKTTGTLARIILPDGTEAPVFRPGRTNVREQLRIIRAAAAYESEALVIECMAVQPALQSICEDRFVQATHGVITNVRPDHLEVMGPTEHDVALALAGTTPKNGRLYTAEQVYLDVFERACRDRGSTLIAIDNEAVAAISEADLAGFSYTEHAENLALALRVCADLDVPRDVALRGMWAATPDPGAMTLHRVGNLLFINGFAANDPQSTGQVWEMAIQRHGQNRRTVALINCRADRPDRSRQLGEAIAGWTPADQVLVIGDQTKLFTHSAKDRIETSRMVSAERESAAVVLAKLQAEATRPTLVVGLGNIGGVGHALLAHIDEVET